MRTITFDPKRLVAVADWEVVAAAMALPWSTSATSILLGLWLITLIPTADLATIWREVKTPAGGLPIMLWLLGVLGMLWADVNWVERLAGLSSFHRLLVLPLLLAQFRRCEHGRWVLYRFLASAVVLLLASWALALGLLSQTNRVFGVVVHDVIAQSTIFLVCAFSLLWPIRDLLHQRNWRLAIGLGGLAIFFLANLVFVAISRADLLVAPILILLLGWRWLNWKGAVFACVAIIMLAVGSWMTSPYLRARVERAVEDVKIYSATHVHNDVGDHVEFLKKSIAFVGEAPVIGHGTGSIPELFRRSAAGQTGSAAVASVNRHNQIFAVAIQLGTLGAAILLAMWFAHYMLFRTTGLVAWIGTVVVVENIISSISSSHLFDFVHGSLYVLGVGVIGGMTLGGSSVSEEVNRPLPSLDRAYQPQKE